MNTQEVWRSLPEELELSSYEVSYSGKLRNAKTGRISIAKPRSDGYIAVVLRDNSGNTSHQLIHRLVAMAWLPNPDNKLTVDHIDRIRHNNAVYNLRWANTAEQRNNINHSKRRGRAVYQIDLEGNIIRKWSKIKDAADALGISKSSIPGACQGKHKHIGGFRWMYCK